MERLRERIQVANRALSAFNEVIKINEPSSIERDAAILRFEFSFEACWKAGKQFLYDVEGLDIVSPKGVIRSSREVDVFSENETILSLRMIDHRNLTVHTYYEELFNEILNKLPHYYQLLRDWMERIDKKI